MGVVAPGGKKKQAVSEHLTVLDLSCFCYTLITAQSHALNNTTKAKGRLEL